MTTVTDDRPAAAEPAASHPANGGVPARRAVVRWGVRLFRREWRQQLLVAALLAIAVAATTIGLAVATNAPPLPRTTWVLPSNDPGLAADIAAVQTAFGPAEVFAHDHVTVPGSLASIDVRSVEAGGAKTTAALRIRTGRLPTAAGEVAVTGDIASAFGLRVGTTWPDLGQQLNVVGIVQNPMAHSEQFAVVAPGQLPSVTNVTVQLDADVSRNQLQSFRLPSGTPSQIMGESAGTKTQEAVTVLVLATLTLLFVGLVSVASFSVLAHRRQRALGMLGSVGATDRHIRLVMLANGASVGIASALAGAAAGLAGWLILSPRVERLADHQIDRFAIPWWAVAAAAALAVVTAVVAAWWPAKSASRVSIVAAIAGRPPQPRPARHVAALGAAVLAAGMVMLAFGRPNQGVHPKPFLIVAGSIATVVGVLLFGPLAIRTLARLAPRLPIAARLALRDLSRYQARSGAALGAATLAIGIASIITISSASQIAKDSAGGGNLPANDLIVYLSRHQRDGGPLPQLRDSDLQTARKQVDTIAGSLHADSTIELDVAVDPASPTIQEDGGPSARAQPGTPGQIPASGTVGRPPVALASVTAEPGGGQAIELLAQLYVATPTVLAYDRIDASRIDTTADVITSRTDLAGLQLVAGGREQFPQPHLQRLGLPKGSSEPNTLLTASAVARLGLQQVPGAWLLTTGTPLTAARIDGARKSAAAAGLTIETRETHHSLAQLGDDATAAGIIFALVVLALTVGLIRSEAANDLRVLTATGASSTTRRSLTAATTGALALLAGLLGVATAYLAMAAFYRSDLHTLTHPPVADLVAIGVGLPAIATAAGWLLAGREPPAISRQPLE